MLIGIVIYLVSLPFIFKIKFKDNQTSAYNIEKKLSKLYSISFLIYIIVPIALSLLIRKSNLVVHIVALMLTYGYLSVQFFSFYKHYDILKLSVLNIVKNWQFIIKLSLVIFALTIIYALFSNWLSHLVHVSLISNNQQGINKVMKSPYKYVLLIQGALLAPMFEEIIFRHILWNFLESKLKFVSKYKYIITMIITSLAFALVHLSGELIHLDVFIIVKIIPYFTIGVVLGYARHKYNNISISLVLHIMNNLSLLLLIF